MYKEYIIYRIALDTLTASIYKYFTGDNSEVQQAVIKLNKLANKHKFDGVFLARPKADAVDTIIIPVV